MNTIVLYLMKVILISGLLYSYYKVGLRNSSFHTYNRWYLLGIPVISLVLPLITLPVQSISSAGGPASPLWVLHEITAGPWNEEATPAAASANWRALLNVPNLIYGIYAGLMLLPLAGLLRSLYSIRRISRSYPCVTDVEELPLPLQKEVSRLQFYWTNEPGTPFSFFQKIFWNRQLDLTSVRGQQIFRHEYYHVRKGHSADILYLEILRVVFWCNPFFHLIGREIRATHEFQADRHAVSGGSPYDYAELLVWQAIGPHSPMLTHPFFNTHLKRRINMLTKSKTNRPGYLSRLLILPLLFLLFCAFAIRLSKKDELNGPVLAPKTLTVVIDAGHGGFDPGAAKDQLLEKDLNLAIAKKIKQFSAAYNVNVLMTRESDIMAGGKTTKEDGLHYRTDFANGHKADLFVSVHVNSKNGDTAGGVEFYLSKQNGHYQQSSLLGSIMIEEMKKSYPTYDYLHEVEGNVYVLRTAAMPAILIECGSLDNPGDVAFITQEKNQELIAKKILQGIVDYQQAGGIAPSSTEDVHPAKEDKLFMNQWYMDLNRLMEKKIPGKGC